MHDPYSPSPAVVVGFDGSRSAMQAALWAIDEAMARNAELQLVYAIESTGKPVKMEADIVHCHPIVTYLEHLHRGAEPVQLLVADPGRVDELLLPNGPTAFDATRCGLLVSDRQRWL
jgi:nucleotide-binding universal stress UspA family protein